MSRSTLNWLISILTVTTAAIHLILAVLDENFRILFTLNGIGYLILLWALLRPPAFLEARQSLMHAAFILFTAVTFIGYFVVNGLALFDPGHTLDLVDKTVELILIGALIIRMRQV
jgi:hypothetical protein